MKILLISLKGLSGSDVYYQLLAKGLKEYNEKIKVSLCFLPNFLEKFPWAIPYYLKKYKINIEDFDIVQTNAEFAYFFKSKNVPLISVMHVLFFHPLYQKYTNFPQKIFHYGILKRNIYKGLKCADIIVSVSNFTKQEILRIYPDIDSEKIEVIYNGIPFEYFNKSSSLKVPFPNKKSLLFVGNPTYRKGFDIVIEIMKNLPSSFVLYYTAGLRNLNKKIVLKNMYNIGKLPPEILELWYQIRIFFFFQRV